MKNDDALKIIEALADGVNPETGAVFVDDSPFQTANITRALCAAAKALKYKIGADDRRKILPVNAGKKWTGQEDNEVSIAFDKGQTVTEIAEFHGRTRGSIQSRLFKLGKVTIVPSL